MITVKCYRDQCAFWCIPKKYKNCCTALEEVPELGETCSFYKSKTQAYMDSAKHRERYLEDPKFRELCKHYGVRPRGRLPRELEDEH